MRAHSAVHQVTLADQLKKILGTGGARGTRESKERSGRGPLASPAQLLILPARRSKLLSSGVERRAARCAARPCGNQASLLPPVVLTVRHGVVVAAAAVSMACSSLASSASISPSSTRSSGLMNPSLRRKPPARATASRSGTARDAPRG